MTDEQLLQACKTGNTGAFKELVMRYQGQVAATVISMLGPGPEADDVGQETFIRFYKSIAKFRGDSSLGTYLTRIAMNLSLNELKRRKKKLSRFFSKTPEEIDIVDRDSDKKWYTDEARIIRKSLQRLEPDFRSVIVLRLMEGYSTQETADILGIPVGTVLSRLSRGQKKLRENLAPLLRESHE